MKKRRTKIRRLPKFWRPWQDEPDILKLDTFVLFGLIFIILVTFVNLQAYPSEQAKIGIYSLLLIWCSIIWLADWVIPKRGRFDIADWVGYNTKHRMLISGLAGVGATIVLSGLVGVPPYTVASALSGFTIGGMSFAFLFGVIVAPYIEERFFASSFTPTAIRLFGPGVGLSASVLLFVLFHGFVFSWAVQPLVMAGIWRFLTLLGNYYFRSTGFSTAAHIMDSYLKYIRI